MRKIALFIILAIFIFVLHPQTLIAQDDDCTIDLSAVYAALGNAQASDAAGNQDAALASIAEARQLLQQIEADCGVSDIANVPTDAVDTSSGPREGAILLIASENGRSTLEFDKLEGIAFVNGFEVITDTLVPNTEMYLNGSEPIAGVIFAGYPRPESLQALYDFANDGGIVIMLYDYIWQNSDELRDLFQMVVVEETIQPTPGQFVYSPEILPPTLQEFEVGVITGSDPQVGISAYLLTPLSGTFEGYAENQDGTERLVTFVNDTGNVIFLPKTQYFQTHTPRYIFEDEHIEQFDNEVAVIALFNFLLGQ